MHYHLRDHIYITQFRDELVLLDAKKDKYTVCFKEFADILMGTLERKSERPRHHNTLSTIKKLVDDGLLEKMEHPYPFQIDQKPHSEGVENVDWRLPLENRKTNLNLQVVSALMTLINVNLSMKFKGFYKTIQLIKKSQKNDVLYTFPKEEALRDLANIVNKACLIYPSRTKCLEWAMTFVLMALKRTWKCNLEIGVQNYPFFAHAWVECDGKVVMDSQDLREGLGIILNEPFRRTII